MDHYKVGDMSRAICNDCEKLVETRFDLAEIMVDDTKVSDILVAFCTVCDQVVAIPAQSTAAIKEAMGK